MKQNILDQLTQIIESRKSGDPETSYVAKLMHKGTDSILKKIGEEATETVMAAKDGNKPQIVYETADLWFHCMIALSQFDLSYTDVLTELERRFGLSGIDEKASRKP